MKKKLIIIAFAILILMSIPLPNQLKDGGSVEYNAILYRYTKVHRLNEESSTGYEDGWKLKILGINVVNKVNQHHDLNTNEYKKSIDDVTLSLKVPNDWKYEELVLDEDEDFYKYALKVYKSDENKFAVLYYYYQQYGTCGTGKEFKEMNLNNGKKAIIGYDYGNDIWNEISFEEINRYIAIINNNLDKEEAKEFISIIKTISIIQNNEKKDISLSVKNKTITSKGATFILKNNTDKEYWYGPDYIVEKNENEKWQEVKTITGEPLVWNAVAYTLKPNEEKEINIDWSLGYGKLDNGQYRLVKTTFKEEDRPIDDSKILHLYAEFEIK